MYHQLGGGCLAGVCMVVPRTLHSGAEVHCALHWLPVCVPENTSSSIFQCHTMECDNMVIQANMVVTTKMC